MGQKTGMMSYLDFPIVERLKKENQGVIPSQLYMEIKNYCRRNSIDLEIHQYGEKKAVKKVCMQCLKAFIIAKANDYYNTDEIVRLANKIKAEIGHSDCYYLDEGVLKRLPDVL